MIYNTRNWSNDTIKSQKEKKSYFTALFHYGQSKITGLNKMWSLCWSLRVELVYMQYQYKWQPGSVLMFCYYCKNGWPRYFVLVFRGTTNLALLLPCSHFFLQNQGFCSCKIVPIKIECNWVIPKTWVIPKIIPSRHTTSFQRL